MRGRDITHAFPLAKMPPRAYRAVFVSERMYVYNTPGPL